MRNHPLPIALAAVLLWGCATSNYTSSGLNEIRIAAPLPRVKAELARVMTDRGYTLKQSDDLLLVGERDAGTAAAVLFGTGANPYAQIRTRATLLPEGDTVRVVLSGVLVDGHGYESPVQANAKTHAWLQQVKLASERP